MSRHLRIALVQAAAEPFERFAAGLRARMASPHAAQLVVYPELHLCPIEGSVEEWYAAHAEPLDGPRGTALGKLARELGIWLIPGTVLERDRDGKVYNTAVVYDPDGELAAAYRKIFTWRPYEPMCVGREFVVFDLPGYGRVGLSICYDAWFPEVTRHLAWLGAELVVNVVQTATAGRAQERPLNQANAIVNQIWVATVNGAAPTALGDTFLVDPEGHIQAEAPAAHEATLVSIVDFDRVAAARKYGTSGDSWPWAQPDPADGPLDLPLYGGRLDPATWRPAISPETPENLRPQGDPVSR